MLYISSQLRCLHVIVVVDKKQKYVCFAKCSIIWKLKMKLTLNCSRLVFLVWIICSVRSAMPLNCTHFEVSTHKYVPLEAWTNICMLVILSSQSQNRTSFRLQINETWSASQLYLPAEESKALLSLLNRSLVIRRFPRWNCYYVGLSVVLHIDQQCKCDEIHNKQTTNHIYFSKPSGL